MAWRAVSFSDAAKERIRQAAAFEKQLRVEALLGVKSTVGAFKLRPMTLRDAIFLDASDNKLLCAGEPDTGDFVHLLWGVADHSGLDEFSFAKWATPALDDQTRKEIQLYCNCQFIDMPALGSGNTVTDRFDSDVWATWIIDIIASQYGWTLAQIMDHSIAALLQLMQKILKRTNDKYMLRNPITQQAKSDEMKAMQNG